MNNITPSVSSGSPQDPQPERKTAASPPIDKKTTAVAAKKLSANITEQQKLLHEELAGKLSARRAVIAGDDSLSLPPHSPSAVAHERPAPPPPPSRPPNQATQLTEPSLPSAATNKQSSLGRSKPLTAAKPNFEKVMNPDGTTSYKKIQEVGTTLLQIASDLKASAQSPTEDDTNPSLHKLADETLEVAQAALSIDPSDIDDLSDTEAPTSSNEPRTSTGSRLDQIEQKFSALKQRTKETFSGAKEKIGGKLHAVGERLRNTLDSGIAAIKEAKDARRSAGSSPAAQAKKTATAVLQKTPLDDTAKHGLLTRATRDYTQNKITKAELAMVVLTCSQKSPEDIPGRAPTMLDKALETAILLLQEDQTAL